MSKRTKLKIFNKHSELKISEMRHPSKTDKMTYKLVNHGHLITFNTEQNLYHNLHYKGLDISNGKEFNPEK